VDDLLEALAEAVANDLEEIILAAKKHKTDAERGKRCAELVVRACEVSDDLAHKLMVKIMEVVFKDVR
jgi:hypothetical protein